MKKYCEALLQQVCCLNPGVVKATANSKQKWESERHQRHRNWTYRWFDLKLSHIKKKPWHFVKAYYKRIMKMSLQSHCEL